MSRALRLANGRSHYCRVGAKPAMTFVPPVTLDGLGHPVQRVASAVVRERQIGGGYGSWQTRDKLKRQVAAPARAVPLAPVSFVEVQPRDPDARADKITGAPNSRPASPFEGRGLRPDVPVVERRGRHQGITGASTQHHPAPFPLELATRLVRMFSFTEDTVMDPFCGSGTTMIAALRTGRNSIGIEIDLEYCRMTARYLKAETSDLFATAELRFEQAPTETAGLLKEKPVLYEVRPAKQKLE
ncbi:MAG: site-specific DNA-methyltransferase [Verrucomicrobia bacterium]|nr:site-specific DNA-methyltransferase [Verrucomicrobiota bacterium]